MRSIINISIVVTLTLGVISAQSGPRVRKGEQPPWPPASGTAEFFLDFPPGYLPESLKQLCDSSRLIVDGYVQTIFPPREASPRSLETDAVLLVSQVLKGTDAGKVVVAQRGGVIGQFKEVPHQYALLQLGEHYIAFLIDDKRPNLPVRVGIPRYGITGAFVGLFRVDGDKIHLSSGIPSVLRTRYEGMNPEQAMTEIRTCVQPAAR
jgi:hypothetical protein